MNYRHAFHVGNHADVLKHTVLAWVLARLAVKTKPFSVLDFFAGAGWYDLALDERALRTGEWRDGVDRVWAAAETAPASLRVYLDAITDGAQGGALRRYPGSPVIAQRALREGDRLTAVERHPEEAAALRAALGRDSQARVAEEDGWTAVKALCPPTPRRGVTLLDPPFEQPGEFDRLSGALAEALKRWGAGVHLLWHPVKDLRATAAYERALSRAARETPLLLLELRVRPASAGGLIGSGLAIANPPYGLADAAAEFGPWLAETLGDGDGAWRAEWLVPDA